MQIYYICLLFATLIMKYLSEILEDYKLKPDLDYLADRNLIKNKFFSKIKKAGPISDPNFINNVLASLTELQRKRYFIEKQNVLKRWFQRKEALTLITPILLKKVKSSFTSQKKVKNPWGGESLKVQSYNGFNGSMKPGAYFDIEFEDDRFGIKAKIDELYCTRENGKLVIDIVLHKVTNVIPTYNFVRRLLFPFDHLADCKYHLYSVELGIIAFLASTYGIKVDQVGIRKISHQDFKKIKKIILRTMPNRSWEGSLFIKYLGNSEKITTVNYTKHKEI